MKIVEIIEVAQLSLYHGTSSAQLSSILANGVSSPSWWGTWKVAAYYAEGVAEEDNSEPVVIEVPIGQFDQTALEADGNSVAEPLTHTLQSTEGTLYRRWQKTDGSWKASLRIYGSVIYRGAPIRVAPQQATNIAPATKPQPDQAQINVYRSFLRLLSWGKELSPQDQQTKAYIERKFDVSRINLK